MRRRKSEGNQGRSDRTVNQDTKDCRKIKGGNMDSRERAGKMMEILRKSGTGMQVNLAGGPWDGADKDQGYLPKGLRLSPELPHHTPGPH